MHIKLPKAYDYRGAAMARGSDWDRQPNGKVKLERMIMVGGDYDQGGAYWGKGLPLWVCETDDSEYILRGYVRARSRELAKLEIIQHWPQARFNR